MSGDSTTASTHERSGHRHSVLADYHWAPEHLSEQKETGDHHAEIAQKSAIAANEKLNAEAYGDAHRGKAATKSINGSVAKAEHTDAGRDGESPKKLFMSAENLYGGVGGNITLASYTPPDVPRRNDAVLHQPPKLTGVFLGSIAKATNKDGEPDSYYSLNEIGKMAPGPFDAALPKENGSGIDQKDKDVKGPIAGEPVPPGFFGTLSHPAEPVWIGVPGEPAQRGISTRVIDGKRVPERGIPQALDKLPAYAFMAASEEYRDKYGGKEIPLQSQTVDDDAPAKDMEKLANSTLRSKEQAAGCTGLCNRENIYHHGPGIDVVPDPIARRLLEKYGFKNVGRAFNDPNHWMYQPTKQQAEWVAEYGNQLTRRLAEKRRVPAEPRLAENLY